jgi:hypothetical protein
VLRALLIPLAVLCAGLGVLIGGRVGNGLVIAGTVLAGVATVLILIEA